jgi:cell division septation protein DedD
MIYSYGTYEGHWQDGVKNGQGIMTYPDGSKYIGQWKNDRRSGQGTYTYFDGGKYEGQWKDGRKNGQGTYFYSDGGKYIGRFKDGNTCGKGIMSFPDGHEYKGELVNGSFVKDQTSEEKGTTTESDAYPYTIQVGSCRNRENAYDLNMMLRKNGFPAFVNSASIPGKGVFHRIFVGYYRTFDETRKAVSQLKDQKDLNPIESRMPYAIQVGVFDSDQELTSLETSLRSKDYLAYSIPGSNDNNKARLLIGAFRTENEAAILSRKLKDEGIDAKVVER